MPLLGYAFALTRSRGGFLALAAGLVTMIVAKLGWRNSIPVTAIALPVLLVLFAGRQTSINLSDKNDTAQGRMGIWRDGMMLLKGSPLFGIGYGEFVEEVGHVAHNSFVHCFVEQGHVLLVLDNLDRIETARLIERPRNSRQMAARFGIFVSAPQTVHSFGFGFGSVFVSNRRRAASAPTTVAPRTTCGKVCAIQRADEQALKTAGTL
jgi:hypothetical protein